MKHALLLVLLGALIGCMSGERNLPSGEREAAEPRNLQSLFEASSSPDTLVHRDAIRLDSLAGNGSPGDARSRVTFSDSTTLDVPIRDAALLVELPVSDRASWLVLAGTECSQCDANRSVWVFRAIPGRITERPLSYVYPGVQSAAGLETLPTFRSRLFVGACLEPTEIAAVWLEDVLQPDSARTRRVRVLTSQPALAEREFPFKEETERRVRSHVTAGRCREVPPMTQIVF